MRKRRALPEFKGEDKLGMPLDGNERPCVAHLVCVAVAFVGFLFSDEAPDFITLDISGRHSAKFGCHQCFAAFASDHQELHDRVTMQPTDALGATDTCTLNQKLEGEQAAFLVDLLMAEHPELFVFAERLPALRTAIPL